MIAIIISNHALFIAYTGGGGGHALCIIDDENNNNKKSLPPNIYIYTVPKLIDLSRNVAGKNEILHEIFRVVCRFPLHFALYLGNLDYFLDTVQYIF